MTCRMQERWRQQRRTVRLELQDSIFWLLLEHHIALFRPQQRAPASYSRSHCTMPTFNLQTNVPGDRVSASQIIADLSKAVASAVGKPESYVLVSLDTGKPMMFGGTEEPCAYGELISIGSIGGEKNKKISAALAEVVQRHLGVPSNRLYIKFYDVARTDFGWSGSTF